MRHYLLSFICTLIAFESATLSCLAATEVTGTDKTESSQIGTHGTITRKLDRITASTSPSKGSQDVDAAYPGTTPLRGINGNNENVSAAPGADAMMTQDLLLVNPNKSGGPPKPLQSFVGNSLTLTVDSKSIPFHGLHGLRITVSNDTSRPIFIDGDKAKAIVQGQSITAVSVAVLQKCVLPKHGIIPDTERFVVQVAPAAATIGVTPTAEDYIKMKKPVRKRYGSDSQRRQAEASRFGTRILWPHQKTEGILYFKTDNALDAAKIEVPIHTLFDVSDSALLASP